MRCNVILNRNCCWRNELTINAKEIAMMRPFFALQKALAVVVAGMFLLSAVVTAQEHTNEHAKDGSHSWSYSGSTGPEHWGDLSPEFAVCKTGKRQSPLISITRRLRTCRRSILRTVLLRSRLSIPA